MVGDSSRRCVRCDHDPGYNREVVDVVSGTAVGSLCRRCECETLDDFLVVGAVDGARCAVCARDGFYALPKWLPETHRVDGAVVTSVDYELDEDVLHFCDEHYHDLLGEATPAVDDVRTPHERR